MSCLLLFLLLALFIAPGAVGQTGDAVVSMTPTNSRICVGTTLSVNLTIANVSTTDSSQMVYGYWVELLYNASVLNCTGISLPADHFLKPVNDGDLYTFALGYDNTYNATYGIVQVILSLLTPDENPKGGSGVLATATFEALSVGTTPLLFNNVEFLSPNDNEISFVPVGGSVQVIAQPVCALKTEAENGYFYIPNIPLSTLRIELLFNGSLDGDQTGGVSPYSTIATYPDGIVNMKDVAYVARHFSMTEGSPGWDYMADCVPNRRIDMSDEALVARHFGMNGTYSTDLTGVSVNFNTGQQSPDSFGFVAIPTGAVNFTVTINGEPTGAMIVFWS